MFWQSHACQNGISICGYFLCGDILKDTKHPEHQKVMRGELREKIFVCGQSRGRTLTQMRQGTVTGEGKI